MIKPDNPKNNKNTFPIFTFTLTLSLTLFHYLIEKQGHHRRSSFLSIQSNPFQFIYFLHFNAFYMEIRRQTLQAVAFSYISEQRKEDLVLDEAKTPTRNNKEIRTKYKKNRNGNGWVTTMLSIKHYKCLLNLLFVILIFILWDFVNFHIFKMLLNLFA